MTTFTREGCGLRRHHHSCCAAGDTEAQPGREACSRSRDAYLSRAKVSGAGVCPSKPASRLHALSQGSANISCKGPDGKCLKFLGPYGVCCKHSAWPLECEGRHSPDTINERGCVPIKSYLWTLRSEFRTIFTCSKIFSSSNLLSSP